MLVSEVIGVVMDTMEAHGDGTDSKPYLVMNSSGIGRDDFSEEDMTTQIPMDPQTGLSEKYVVLLSMIL